MFGNKEKPVLSFYSNFLIVVIAFAASFLLLDLLLSQEEMIYGLFKDINFQQVGMFLNLCSVVALFLIFNTSYYAFLSTHPIKMLLYSSVFLSVGWGQLLSFVHGGAAGFNIVSNDLIYGSFGHVVLAAGLLVGSLIDSERRMERHNTFVFGVCPILGMILLECIRAGFAMWILSSPSVGLAIFQIILEYMAATMYFVTILIYINKYSQTKNRFLLHSAVGLLVIIFAEALKIVYGNPKNLTFLLFTLYQAVGLLILYSALFRDAIHAPLEQLISAEKQIKLYAENLERIVERRTSEARAVNSRFLKELDYARSIQQSLLPTRKKSFKTATFTAEYFPCERLGGDFFDFYNIDDDNVGMYVLDVSGHGISAALMTMFCINYIKSTERLIKRYRGLKPHRNLKHFYEEFNKMNFPEEMHMVIFYAAYNTVTRTLTYSSGGMNCFPILVRPDGSYEYLDKSSGFPICRFGDFFDPEYESVKISLQEGDRIIFYTDGLIDTTKNQALDQDGLIELMQSYHDRPVKSLNRELISRINRSGEKLDDDITYFIMEVTG